MCRAGGGTTTPVRLNLHLRTHERMQCAYAFAANHQTMMHNAHTIVPKRRLCATSMRERGLGSEQARANGHTDRTWSKARRAGICEAVCGKSCVSLTRKTSRQSLHAHETRGPTVTTTVRHTADSQGAQIGVPGQTLPPMPFPHSPPSLLWENSFTDQCFCIRVRTER